MNDGVSRRAFLAGIPAAAVVGAGLFYVNRSDQVKPSPTLVPLYSSDRVIAAGVQQRIPFAVVDDERTEKLKDSDSVTVRVLREGEVVEELAVPGRVVEHDHAGEDVDPNHQHAKLFRYYPLKATLPEPGIYDLDVVFEDVTSTMPVQAFAPDDIGLVVPGEMMPKIKSATITSPGNVDTLCTRFEGQCPFHDRSVAELLGESKPLAVLVATPALCSTAYCGPVLELLVAAAERFPSILMCHIEPYSNAAEVGNNYADPDIQLADSVIELGLDFEPSLFLVDETGKLVERIDNLFDASELEDALNALAK